MTAIWRGHVPLPVAVATVGLVTVVGLAAGYLLLTARPGPGSIGEYHVRGLLPPGAATPAFHAAGWINGPPPRPGAPGQQLIILDIWAHW
jgi:hypothetical protein